MSAKASSRRPWYKDRWSVAFLLTGLGMVSGLFVYVTIAAARAAKMPLAVGDVAYAANTITVSNPKALTFDQSGEPHSLTRPASCNIDPHTSVEVLALDDRGNAIVSPYHHNHVSPDTIKGKCAARWILTVPRVLLHKRLPWL